MPSAQTLWENRRCCLQQEAFSPRRHLLKSGHGLVGATTTSTITRGSAYCPPPRSVTAKTRTRVPCPRDGNIPIEHSFTLPTDVLLRRAVGMLVTFPNALNPKHTRSAVPSAHSSTHAPPCRPPGFQRKPNPFIPLHASRAILSAPGTMPTRRESPHQTIVRATASHPTSMRRGLARQRPHPSNPVNNQPGSSDDSPPLTCHLRRLFGRIVGVACNKRRSAHVATSSKAATASSAAQRQALSLEDRHTALHLDP